jgi:phage/plasmid-like protein (TIGR03299 family)
MTNREFKFVKNHEQEIYSATDLMNKSNLDWKVSLNPVYAAGSFDPVPIDDKFATVKTTSNGEESVLSVVGGRYKVFQNSEIFSSLDPLVESGITKYGAAGELGGGKTVWAVLQFSSEISIGNDPHAAYILARTSHDGSTPFQLAPMINRISCTNQINAKFQEAKKNNSYYSIRHTTNSVVDFDTIKSVFNVIREDIKHYTDISSWLLNQSFDDGEFRRFLGRVYPMPSIIQDTAYDLLSPAQRRVHSSIIAARGRAQFIWDGGTGTQTGIAGTKFAAFQTIIEEADHGAATMDGFYRQERKIITGKDLPIKNRAYELLRY